MIFWKCLGFLISLGLTFLLRASGDIPYQQIVHFSDAEQVEKDVYLRRPVDAISDSERIFVADAEGKCVFLLERKTIKKLGGEGTGPGFFKNHPQKLVLDNGSLLVYEFNFWEVSRFSLEGEFLKKWKNQDRKNRHVIRIGDVEIRKFSAINDLPAFGRGTCYFGYLQKEEPLRSGGVFRLAIGLDGTVILGHGSGVLSLVGESCEVNDIFRLKLGRFSKEPEKDKGNLMSFNGAPVQLYSGGAPLLQMAAKTSRQMWALVNNEHTDQRFLYEINLDEKKVVFKAPLSYEFDQIRYSHGLLILLSRKDAVVVAYQIP